MELNLTRILLTGATGGLGQALARELAAAGADLLLAGRDAEKLARIQAELAATGREVRILRADLNQAADIEDAAQAARVKLQT